MKKTVPIQKSSKIPTPSINNIHQTNIPLSNKPLTSTNPKMSSIPKNVAQTQLKNTAIPNNLAVSNVGNVQQSYLAVSCANNFANLNNTQLQASLAAANKESIYKSNVVASNIHRSNAAASNIHQSNLPASNVHQSNIPSTNIHQSNIAASNVHQSSIAASNIHQSNLPASNVHQSNIAASSVHQSNLPGSSIHQSNIAASNIHQSNLPVTNVHQSNIAMSNIHQSNLPVPGVHQSNIVASNIQKSQTHNKNNITVSMQTENDKKLMDSIKTSTKPKGSIINSNINQPIQASIQNSNIQSSLVNSYIPIQSSVKPLRKFNNDSMIPGQCRSMIAFNNENESVQQSIRSNGPLNNNNQIYGNLVYQPNVIYSMGYQ